MKTNKYTSTIGFIDLLFNILTGFAYLFIVSFILIQPNNKKKDFERKAEFVIILEWPEKRNDDMDLWVADPAGDIVNFRNKRVNLMHLDKDDFGLKNDTVIVNGKKTIVHLNREVVTIRGIIPGEFVANAHLYHMRTSVSGEQTFDVTIQVIKVNPFKMIFEGKKTFSFKGEEQTFVRFTVDNDGEVIETNELERYLAMSYES